MPADLDRDADSARRDRSGKGADEPSIERGKLERAREAARSLRAELEGMRGDLEASERKLERTHTEVATTRQRWGTARTSLEAELTRVGQLLESIERSRSWRLAHAVTSGLHRMADRPSTGATAPASALKRLADARAMLAELPDEAPVPKLAAEGRSGAQLAGELRRRLGPPERQAASPPVSVVVTGAGDTGNFQRLLAGLAQATDYGFLEIVLGDECSARMARRLLRSLGASLRVVAAGSPEASSPGRAANRSAAAARHGVLLFVDATVEPFESGWLQELVSCLSESGGAAAGPILLEPEGGAGREADVTALRHRSSSFTDRRGQIGVAEEVVHADARIGYDVEVSISPNGCLLVEREHFEQVGGFTPGYQTRRLAGVDLGLKLLAEGGSLLSCGRSLILDHPAPVAPTEPGEREVRDARLLGERWAPTLRRGIWRDRLSPARSTWSSGGLRAGVVGPEQGPGRDLADGLAEKLEGLGWCVDLVQHEPPSSLGQEVDLMAYFGAPAEIPHRPASSTVTFVPDPPGRWVAEKARLEHFDTVLVEPGGEAESLLARSAAPATPLTSQDRESLPERAITTLRRRVEALSFCVKIGAPTWEAAQQWGDLAYARSLRAELERRGHPCLIQAREDWGDTAGLSYDVALQLRGRGRYDPRPGQFNVLWNISHPAELTPEECDRFDLILVASSRFAERLGSQTSAIVAGLEQATDHHVFFPDYDPDYAHELVFVGNSRKVERRILRDLLPTHRDLAVWGRQWEGLSPEAHVMGPHLPTEEVRKAYSSAAIVLNDHWDDMREYGFVSNRIYDALACGALVISDHLPEVAQRFGDAVVTYEHPAGLADLVEHFLENPEERGRRGEHGRAMVRAQHTFVHRVETLLEEIAAARGNLDVQATRAAAKARA